MHNECLVPWLEISAWQTELLEFMFVHVLIDRAWVKFTYRQIYRDPGQLCGLSWSGRLHLSAPGGLSLSFSVQLDVQSLSTPPPTQPPLHRSRPVQLSHAWPSLGIHSGCFLFRTSTPLSHTVLYSQSFTDSPVTSEWSVHNLFV